jgi:capsular polysaccharide biosynthesis protein
MGGYNAKMAAAPIRQQQIVDLARNYQVSSTDYASLLQKTSSSQLAAELEKRQKGERFTILDAATVPGRPFKPNRRSLMLGAVFAAFCFSVMVFVVKDMISGTVRNEDDLLKMLPGEAPVLAVIPAIDTPTILRRRRLQNLAVIAIVVVACGVEVLIFLSIRPIL